MKTMQAEYKTDIGLLAKQNAERDTRMAEQNAERDTRMAEQNAERDTRMAERDTRMAQRDTRIAERDTANTRWIVGSIAVAALFIVAVLGLLIRWPA